MASIHFLFGILCKNHFLKSLTGYYLVALAYPLIFTNSKHINWILAFFMALLPLALFLSAIGYFVRTFLIRLLQKKDMAVLLLGPAETFQPFKKTSASSLIIATLIGIIWSFICFALNYKQLLSYDVFMACLILPMPISGLLFPKYFWAIPCVYFVSLIAFLLTQSDPQTAIALFISPIYLSMAILISWIGMKIRTFISWLLLTFPN